MNSNSRACIAFIAAGLCSKNGTSVYDHDQSKQISISGKVDTNSVNIHDHDRSCDVSGAPSNLYDYGNNAHIQLTMNSTQFSGYDYHTSNNFSGSVNGSSISVFDYETGIHYNYSVINT